MGAKPLPIVYPLVLYQGASKVIEATYRDPDALVLPLSGFAARLQIRRSIPDDAVLIDLSSGTGIILTDTSPNITIQISRDETRDLPTGNMEIEDWVYDLLIWDTADPDFTTSALLRGSVFVIPATTRLEP